MSVERYPLTWPTGWKRTVPSERIRAKFYRAERIDHNRIRKGGAAMTKPLRFTPRTESGERLSMRLSAEDRAKIKRGEGWTATVTDLDTGKIYQVRAADCGLRCYCDAIAVEIKGKGVRINGN